MRRMFVLCAALAAAVAAGGARADDRLAITDVVAESLGFRPDRGEDVTWRYATTAPGAVTVSIYDSRDILVRQVVDRLQLPAGSHRVTWDGKDDRGRTAPAGYYLLVMEAEAGGTSVRYDPTDTTGGSMVQAGGIRYDAAAGAVRYSIPKRALIRVNVGIEGDGPLMGTVVDWVARSAGEHAEPWNGWDASGVVQVGRSQGLDVQVWAYDLPVNAVVVEMGEAREARGRQGRGLTPRRTEFLSFGDDRPRREQGAPPRHEMYNHWRHDRGTCHNPAVSLVAANSKARADGTVLVDGPVRLRLELPPEDAAFLQEERFETVIYLDGSFVTEEEQGYLPFSWYLKPEIVPPGEHVVTFMLRGYEGHFGSASIRVHRPGAAGGGAGGSQP